MKTRKQCVQKAGKRRGGSKKRNDANKRTDIFMATTFAKLTEQIQSWQWLRTCYVTYVNVFMCVHSGRWFSWLKG